MWRYVLRLTELLNLCAAAAGSTHSLKLSPYSSKGGESLVQSLTGCRISLVSAMWPIKIFSLCFTTVTLYEGHEEGHLLGKLVLSFSWWDVGYLFLSKQVCKMWYRSSLKLKMKQPTSAQLSHEIKLNLIVLLSFFISGICSVWIALVGRKQLLSFSEQLWSPSCEHLAAVVAEINISAVSVN